MSVRLLGVAVGALDTNEPRGTTRGDAAFVVETLRGEKPVHSSPPPAPRPSAMLRGCLCSVCVFDVSQSLNPQFVATGQ